jgi:hypothetical protein
MILLTLEVACLLPFQTPALTLCDARLLAFEAATLLSFDVLRLLTFEAARLHALEAVALLALGPHLGRRATPLAMAVTAASSEEGLGLAAAVAMSATAATEEGLRLAAAVAMSATAASSEEGLGLAAAVTAISAIAMSSATNCGWWTSAAIAVASATAMTALVRVGRGCDREHGCAGCEKYPGQHRKNSFRTGKTVRSLHRSNT